MTREFKTAGGITVCLYPESFMALQRELEHPAHVNFAVETRLKPPISEAEAMARLCTYANVAVDDVYDPDDFDTLCQVVLARLQDRRKLILN